MTATTLEQILTERRGANREIVNVDEPTIRLVIVALGDRIFAFQGERIREILGPTEIFFVPGAPAALAGVIHVRGEIESVLRPSVLLRLPEGTDSGAGTILIGQGQTLRSGLRVDRVIDVVDLPQSRLQPPPETLPEELRPYVLGLLRLDEGAAALLDLERLFVDYAEGRR